MYIIYKILCTMHICIVQLHYFFEIYHREGKLCSGGLTSLRVPSTRMMYLSMIYLVLLAGVTAA